MLHLCLVPVGLCLPWRRVTRDCMAHVRSALAGTLLALLITSGSTWRTPCCYGLYRAGVKREGAVASAPHHKQALREQLMALAVSALQWETSVSFARDDDWSRSRKQTPSRHYQCSKPITSKGDTEILEQLERVRKTRRRDLFEALLERMPLVAVEESSIVVQEAFVRAAASCNELELAIRILNSLLHGVEAGDLRAQWRPRWDTFSLIMEACRRARDINGLMHAFKASLGFQGFNRTVVLNILLAGLCEAGRMDVATFYLSHAEEKWGVVPNAVSWNTLLGWAVRTGRDKLIDDLSHEMARRRVQGDVTTSNIRLRYLLATRPEEGVAFFESLRAQGGEGFRDRSTLDLVTVNIMAGYLAKSRGFDEAFALVKEMQSTLGMSAEVVTHNILLDSLFREGRLDDAMRYFEALVDTHATTEKSSTSCDEVGEPPGLAEAGAVVGVWGGRADSTTYDIVLSGLVKCGRLSAAMAVHDRMSQAGLQPTIYTFAALARMQKSSVDVCHIWSRARAKCPRMTLPFLNLVMYELGHVHGDLEGAFCAFLAVATLRMRPNIVTYNTLIAALVKEPRGVVIGSAAQCPLDVMGPIREGRGSLRGEQGGETGDHATLGDAVELLASLRDMNRLEAALAVLRKLCTPRSTVRPNARTFTILLAAVSKAMDAGPRSRALCDSLYTEALAQNVTINGIFSSALLRAFGPDAKGALSHFKSDLRPQLKKQDAEAAAGSRTDNLVLGYMALLYVCGVAGRPDLALQVLYAMRRDGLRPGPQAWGTYTQGRDHPSHVTPPQTLQLLLSPYEGLLKREAEGWGEQSDTTWLKKIRIRW